MVAVTSRRLSEITETEFEPSFPTYSLFDPIGTARPIGAFPTWIVESTFPVAPSNALTVSGPRLVAQAVPCARNPPSAAPPSSGEQVAPHQRAANTPINSVRDTGPVGSLAQNQSDRQASDRSAVKAGSSRRRRGRVCL